MQEEGITKLYYSIREVTEMVEEKAHVLRFWETEFDELHPRKSRAGKRVYTEADIATVRRIQFLLREEKYTLEGARQVFERAANGLEAPLQRELRELRGFLAILLERLEGEGDEEP